MLPTFPTVMYPELQYGPLILSSVITLLMTTMCVHLPVKQGLIGYICLFSGVAGVITAGILFASSGRFLFEYAAYPFYGIYISFMFIPVLISFHRIAKQQKLKDNSKTSIRMGTALIYLGYIWSIVFFATTIAVTVIRSALGDDMDVADYQKKTLMYAKATNFLFHSHWGFIAINLILTALFYKHFDNKSSRCTLICFNIFTIIPLITMAAYSHIDYPTSDRPSIVKALGIAFIFLVDLPNSMAILAWFIINGHRVNTQKTDTLSQKEEEDSKQSSENIPVTRSREAQATKTPIIDHHHWMQSLAAWYSG